MCKLYCRKFCCYAGGSSWSGKHFHNNDVSEGKQFLTGTFLHVHGQVKHKWTLRSQQEPAGMTTLRELAWGVFGGDSHNPDLPILASFVFLVFIYFFIFFSVLRCCFFLCLFPSCPGILWDRTKRKILVFFFPFFRGSHVLNLNRDWRVRE